MSVSNNTKRQPPKQVHTKHDLWPVRVSLGQRIRHHQTHGGGPQEHTETHTHTVPQKTIIVIDGFGFYPLFYV